MMLRYGEHHLDIDYLRQSALPRIQKYVRREGDCLVWFGAKTAYRDGAARRSALRVKTVGGKAINVYVHRLLALIKHGDEANAGLQVDHTCLNTFCVCVDHLEFVTPKVNTDRGRAGSGKPKSAEHCAKISTALCGRKLGRATKGKLAALAKERTRAGGRFAPSGL